MHTRDIFLRTLVPADIEAAMALSVAEGWNQTEKDWRFLIEDTDNICVAATIDGKLIATTVALDYGGKLAWLGMVLVNKAHRGKGVSRMLLQYVFERYSAACKLDATDLGEPVYRKVGFLPAYRITRMVTAEAAAPANRYDHPPQKVSPAQYAQIVALDAITIGAERQKLIHYLLMQYPQSAWMLGDNACIEGFALGRDGYRYQHIGPVVASSTGQAEALIGHALSKLRQQPVVIDILSDKIELIPALQQMGFSAQRQFVRMFKARNAFPGVTSKLFAIAGPELG